MTNYIKPECMPYYYKDNTQISKEAITQSIAYNADGYLLPCCWCDALSTKKDIDRLGLYDKSLKLSNNENVEDILNSSIWKTFIETIMHNPQYAPRCCQEKCGGINE